MKCILADGTEYELKNLRTKVEDSTLVTTLVISSNDFISDVREIKKVFTDDNISDVSIQSAIETRKFAFSKVVSVFGRISSLGEIIQATLELKGA